MKVRAIVVTRTGGPEVLALEERELSGPGAGEVLVIIGASGSGKSTIASMITGSIRPTSGSIMFGDLAVHQMNRKALRAYHSNVQMVFQDPYGALNPLHTAEYTVGRPCQNYLGMTAMAARQRVHELLGIGPHLIATARRPPDAQ